MRRKTISMMKGHLHNSLRALFLSLAVLLSLPMLAVEVEIDGVNYDFNAETKQAIVKAKSSGEYSGEVVIPESVEHQGTTYSVTSIGDNAFQRCSGLSSVTIGNSVTNIGDYVFAYCYDLTSVSIGNNVTSIGDYAFAYCSGLSSVTIPNSVKSLGNSAFYFCSRMTSVTIGNNVTSIGDYAFASCNALSSVTIPNSVKSLGNSAFYGCSGLTSVTIPNSVTSIGDNAFSWCSRMTSVTIPNSVESIGSSAFERCSGLTSITIPNSVTSIGNSAFQDCSGLTSVTIGSGVNDIGDKAFAKCSKLLDVYCYAEKVSTIKVNAFDSSYPEKVTLHVPSASVESYKKTEPWSGFSNIVAISTEIDGINYEFDAETKQATVLAKIDGQYSGEIVIPESVECGGTTYSVTSIGRKAFDRCSGLTSVTIPNSVKSIGGNAFGVFCNLSSVHISDIAAWCNIEFGDINSNPLYNADHLYLNGEEVKDLVIPNSVTSIGNYAFVNCPGLTSVTIPNSVTSIGNSAFYGCSSLTSVTIPNSVTSIGRSAFLSCHGLTSVTIPNSVTSIGENAFIGCSGLTSVTIGNSVTSIGDYAFSGCSGLTSVTIPNSVKSIGNKAFSGCSGLTSVTIGNSVESIGDYAFDKCSGLTSVTIPNSVKSIGLAAFRNCSGLTSVHISDIVAWCNIDFLDNASNPLYNAHHLYLDGEEVKDLVIPNSVTSIGDNAFAGCSGLTSVTIPNSVKSIGNKAFSGCSGLTSVTTGNSVESIGDYAFDGCSGLTSIIMGIDIKNIGTNAFVKCSGLLDVYCYAIKLPSTESDAFDGSNPEKVTLHVPSASVKSYTQTEPWSSFGKIVGLSAEIDGVNYDFNAETKQATVIAKSSGKYSGEIVIPESVEYVGTTYSVTSIGDNAFSGCSGLTSVTIPNSVTSIGGGAFYECSGLTSVTIPNSVTSIGSTAFYKCSGLTSVTIPNSVTSLGGGAFAFCSGLTSVTIGNSVTSIGESAFSRCSGLKSVHISDIAAWCNIDFASYDSNPIYYAHHLYLNGEEIKDLVIPNSVTSIGAYAFRSCSGLTSVTIGNGVESIGEDAFWDCSGLTSVTIGNSVESIGEAAFCDCLGLLDVYCYAENVPSTESYTFEGSWLENATLHVPDGSIDFYNSTEPWSSFGKIVSLLCSEVEINGINYELNGETKQATVIEKSSGEYSGEVAIPESVEHEGTAYSVTSIGELAFWACDGLTSVTIPNSVMSIGQMAFYGCSGLTSVTIPNSVTSIEGYAFYGCSGLTSIVVDEGNSVYDSRNNCNAIIKTATNTLHSGCQTTVIPNSVTSIGDGAFAECDLTSVTIPNSVKSIGDNAFIYCSGLTSVTIPNSVTSIGDHAFHGCYGLTSVTIGNSVTSIGEWAFSWCNGLTSVTIGNSITSIGKEAFYKCSGLQNVYCYAENVPSTESNAFDGSSIGTATLHVPAVSVESYRTTEPWSGFETITPLIEDLTLTDGEEFENNTEQTFRTLTYTRTLPNLYWNALYVPFEIPVAEIAEKYEVAYINDINSYDKNDDGAIDDMEMEIIKIKSGTLNANYPYLIKARNEEARNMSITLENATLYPTVSTTIDCSSVFAKHEVTGIYDRKYQNELPEGCMAISVNGAWQPIATGSYLNPFRLYMTVSARDGSPVKVEPAALSRIRISVLGEDDMETGVEETENGNRKTEKVILDLSGRRVQNPEKGGVYIVNGKKVVY